MDIWTQNTAVKDCDSLHGSSPANRHCFQAYYSMAFPWLASSNYLVLSTVAIVVVTPVDECSDNTDNCHEQATCNDTDESFTCTCNAGFEGNGTFCAGNLHTLL